MRECKKPQANPCRLKAQQEMSPEAMAALMGEAPPQVQEEVKDNAAEQQRLLAEYQQTTAQA